MLRTGFGDCFTSFAMTRDIFCLATQKHPVIPAKAGIYCESNGWVCFPHRPVTLREVAGSIAASGSILRLRAG
jgi:hypothetical protein